jgi:hypothetical protein
VSSSRCVTSTRLLRLSELCGHLCDESKLTPILTLRLQLRIVGFWFLFLFYVLFVFFFPVVRGVEPRAFRVLSKTSPR